MVMPGRKYAAATMKYRYGFNGKENDNDVKGDGNQQDYGMRIYDSRLGKFLSIDPLTKYYVMLTPYQFASNIPVSGIDLDGEEFVWFTAEQLEKKMFGTSHLQKIGDGFKGRAVETFKGIGSIFKSAYESLKNGGPVMGGIDPNRNMPTSESLKHSGDVIANAGKAIIQDYSNLVSKAAKGDDEAIGALGFETILFIIPGGEETKGATSIPRGFKNAEQFLKVGQEFASALEKSGIKFEEIGVQGSSVSGKSFRTGDPFRWTGKKPSDIDAYVLLKEDIGIKGGILRVDFIHPDKMLKNYPALKEWSDKWTQILGRDITPAAIKPPKK